MSAVCRIVTDAVRPEDLLREAAAPSDGAVAVFLGAVRDEHDGRPVDHLEYHAYPEMALEELHRIATDLASRHGVGSLVMVHRTGELAIGEISVAVVVTSPHRREALACCAEAIEEIKRRLPVWKKEFYRDGGNPAWVYGPDEGCAGEAEDHRHG